MNSKYCPHHQYKSFSLYIHDQNHDSTDFFPNPNSVDLSYPCFDCIKISSNSDILLNQENHNIVPFNLVSQSTPTELNSNYSPSDQKLTVSQTNSLKSDSIDFFSSNRSTTKSIPSRNSLSILGDGVENVSDNDLKALISSKTNIPLDKPNLFPDSSIQAHVLLKNPSPQNQDSNFIENPSFFESKNDLFGKDVTPPNSESSEEALKSFNSPNNALITPTSAQSVKATRSSRKNQASQIGSVSGSQKDKDISTSSSIKVSPSSHLCSVSSSSIPEYEYFHQDESSRSNLINKPIYQKPIQKNENLIRNDVPQVIIENSTVNSSNLKSFLSTSPKKKTSDPNFKARNLGKTISDQMSEDEMTAANKDKSNHESYKSSKNRKGPIRPIKEDIQNKPDVYKPELAENPKSEFSQISNELKINRDLKSSVNLKKEDAKKIKSGDSISKKKNTQLNQVVNGYSGPAKDPLPIAIIQSPGASPLIKVSKKASLSSIINTLNSVKVIDASNPTDDDSREAFYKEVGVKNEPLVSIDRIPEASDSFKTSSSSENESNSTDSSEEESDSTESSEEESDSTESSEEESLDSESSEAEVEDLESGGEEFDGSISVKSEKSLINSSIHSQNGSPTKSIVKKELIVNPGSVVDFENIPLNNLLFNTVEAYPQFEKDDFKTKSHEFSNKPNDDPEILSHEDSAQESNSGTEEGSELIDSSNEESLEEFEEKSSEIPNFLHSGSSKSKLKVISSSSPISNLIERKLPKMSDKLRGDLKLNGALNSTFKDCNSVINFNSDILIEKSKNVDNSIKNDIDLINASTPDDTNIQNKSAQPNEYESSSDEYQKSGDDSGSESHISLNEHNDTSVDTDEYVYQSDESSQSSSDESVNGKGSKDISSSVKVVAIDGYNEPSPNQDYIGDNNSLSFESSEVKNSQENSVFETDKIKMVKTIDPNELIKKSEISYVSQSKINISPEDSKSKKKNRFEILNSPTIKKDEAIDSKKTKFDTDFVGNSDEDDSEYFSHSETGSEARTDDEKSSNKSGFKAINNNSKLHKSPYNLRGQTKDLQSNIILQDPKSDLDGIEAYSSKVEERDSSEEKETTFSTGFSDKDINSLKPLISKQFSDSGSSNIISPSLSNSGTPEKLKKTKSIFEDDDKSSNVNLRSIKKAIKQHHLGNPGEDSRNSTNKKQPGISRPKFKVTPLSEIANKKPFELARKNSLKNLAEQSIDKNKNNKASKTGLGIAAKLSNNASLRSNSSKKTQSVTDSESITDSDSESDSDSSASYSSDSDFKSNKSRRAKASASKSIQSIKSEKGSGYMVGKKNISNEISENDEVIDGKRRTPRLNISPSGSRSRKRARRSTLLDL
ncbi:hypothetical protein AYI68_g7936 [Smittium mucronatum]|uniref:Uncharacterized protein n=1 Tax=Smittium mucronatum TaxID=133383 RepID=A0A1R0GM97_9FUNG|nr:hypothetical protein AYI68_g7936 [Smittium mucronatum]